MTERKVKSNNKIEIHKKVEFDDLHWDCVHERLSARISSAGLEVDLLIKQFISQFFGALKAHWVAPAELPQGNNLVAAALCECHGCDEITIERKSEISFGVGRIPVFQSLRFKVQAVSAGTEDGRTGLVSRLLSGLVEIGPKRFSIAIHSYNTLLLFSALSVFAVSMFYAMAALLVIHGLAVFMLFLSEPDDIIILATKRADVGIALLSFCVGVTALLRGSIKLLYRWIKLKLN